MRKLTARLPYLAYRIRSTKANLARLELRHLFTFTGRAHCHTLHE